MRVAAIDLGSNSFHLLVADVRGDGTFEPLARDKEMLRLGSVVAATGSIGETGTAAAVDTVRRFKAVADSLGAEVVACATAAFRDAADSLGVVDSIESATGVRVRVISGREEARLIFEAVRTSVVIDPSPALALDLGGGSLEVMVGRQSGLLWSSSVRLGVARLTTELVRDEPPAGSDRRRLAHAVNSAFTRILPDVMSDAPKVAIGSSGTLAALIRLAAPASGGSPTSVNQLSVSLRELQELSSRLFAMTSAERAELPGVDARRADLLPAGALLITSVMELAGINRLVGCEWALREGMVLDVISRHSRSALSGDPGGIRRESVLSLCRRSTWNEAHGRKVAGLALEMFDGTVGLHDLGTPDRELLEYGALLHDVGEHISVEGHDQHTAYLIEHGRLRGFSPEEVAELACLGRFHRRGSPKASFEPFGSLSSERRRKVAQMVALLRVADGLDRSHGGPVTGVSVYASQQGRVEVLVEATDDIDLELWGLRRKRELFERLFRVRLEVVPALLELPLELPG